MDERAADIFAVFEPVRTAKVLTTASFALNPVSNAVEARQSPKPSGAKMGAIQRPIPANMLSSPAETGFKRTSKLCKNQMMMVATKITVKARVKKSFALSHSSMPTLLGLGSR